MDKLTKADLQTLVNTLQGKLNLIMAIDYIRDTAPDPPAMLNAIGDLLYNAFDLSACALFLLNRHTSVLELKVCHQPDLTFTISKPALNYLLEKITTWDDIQLWTPHDLLPLAPHITLPKQLYTAVMPIVLDTPDEVDKRLGIVLLLRQNVPFSQTEVQLLKAAESQIDSAIIQGHVDYELRQRNKELEAIYRIDHIRDQQLPFETMLKRVLAEIRLIIPAEMGFIMLYNQTTSELSMKAVMPADLPGYLSHHAALLSVAEETLTLGDVVCHHQYDPTIHSILCVPLDVNGSFMGVLGLVDYHQTHQFQPEDIRLLKGVTSQIDTAIFVDIERQRMRGLLSRSVGAKVLKRLLASVDTGMLKPERSIVTVLYADLVGSTQLAERTEPDILVEYINDFLKTTTQIVYEHEGTLDKFVGDMVMALFNVPFVQPDHALRAVQTALDMHVAHKAIIERWQQYGIDQHPMAIGIATGELTVGEMGFEQRSNYTVIGRAANLGARLCSRALSHQTLICPTTYEMVKEQVVATPYPSISLKGLDGLITVYDVHRMLWEEK